MAHALLSPSSAHRGFNCPASVTRSEIVDRRADMLREVGVEFYGLDAKRGEEFKAILTDDNSASTDGTALHKAFEYAMIAKEVDAVKIETLIKSVGVSSDVLDDDFVMQGMIETCKEYVEYCENVDKRWVEKRVKIKGLPQFGTVDLVTVKGKQLGIHDLKTGRNDVQAEDNYQLLCYAVGMLDELGWDKFDDVLLEIIGIRFKSTNVLLKVEDVKSFKHDIMLPAFMDAYSINPTAKVGSWCQYCSAKLYCNEWAEAHEKVFDNVFMDDMSEKTNEELEHLFNSFNSLKQLVDGQVKTELLLRFDTFNEPTGVKRVNGGEVVKWKVSEKEIEKTLANVAKPDTLYKRTLKTPKQVKALLDDESSELVEDLVEYSTKKPYLKKL